MKNAAFQATLSLVLLAGAVPAATFSTLPPSGVLTGAPGDTVGWGFSSTNDDFFQSISFGQSILINETNPLIGTYTDWIGPQGGPDNFAVDPGQTWSEGFSLINQTGLGSFTIDPAAALGSSDSGLIRVFFNFADSTPGTIDVPFYVFVAASDPASDAPEPATAWLLLAGGLAIFASRRRNTVKENL
jgi:PEP-CTERM motif-containing protein